MVLMFEANEGLSTSSYWSLCRMNNRFCRGSEAGGCESTVGSQCGGSSTPRLPAHTCDFSQNIADKGYLTTTSFIYLFILTLYYKGHPNSISQHAVLLAEGWTVETHLQHFHARSTKDQNPAMPQSSRLDHPAIFLLQVKPNQALSRLQGSWSM